MSQPSARTTVKDFSVIRLLGKGSYGSVYKVARKSDGFEYALKKVNLREFNTRERKEAVNEIRLLASLFHNSIVRYCEAFVDGDYLYIVTEYAKRGDLDRRIRHQKAKNHYFRESTVWNYFLQMLAGLRYLHQQSVLHRDLKPKNIFLTAADQVRIGDLGCSKLMKSRLTRTQVGTPYYMSPEIWRHMSYNAKSDVWSLGCILFEMCALRPPFQAHDMRSLQQKVLNHPTPRIPSCYSRELSEVVSRMLTKDPAMRPGIQEMRVLDAARLAARCSCDRRFRFAQLRNETGEEPTTPVRRRRDGGRA